MQELSRRHDVEDDIINDNADDLHVSFNLDNVQELRTFFESKSQEENLDKLEHKLEEEIEYDNKVEMLKTTFGALRKSGHHLIHNKHVLLALVALNGMDCLLLLCELMVERLADLNDKADLKKRTPLQQHNR